jgi:hypothetical protein
MGNQDVRGFLPTNDKLITNVAYDGANNVEYVGKAEPGSVNGDTVWLIQKFVYTGAYITGIRYPAGKADFTAEWDERANYTYA